MKQIILLSFLIMISGMSSAQKGNSGSSFFFIQVTDPQFGMYDSDKSFGKETALFEKAVSAINRLKPEFVVITGDLVNNRENKNEKTEFKRICAEILKGIPVYYLPGNHDIGQSPAKSDIVAFNSDYGNDRFSFKIKKNLFIGINSSLIKANTPMMEQEQYNWLEKELSGGKRAKHRIIFCHYPLFINSFDEPETYSNIAPETRYKYLSLLKEKNVDAVFAGHLHNNASSKYGNMMMITTSAVGKPLAQPPSGIRIIKVFSDRIESEFYGLDQIPAFILP
jgi:serine/threonine-protein phosphatase CPPED1